MADPDITARAQEVKAQAAALPTEQQIEDLAARAVAHGGTRSMSLAQVRAKANEARENARQLADRLAELSALLEEHPDEHPGNPGGGGET